MALANYNDLKQSVAYWLKRPDLDAYIPDFITLCEQRIAYGAGDPFPSGPVRVVAMETAADLTVSSGTAAAPSDFQEGIRIYLDGNPRGIFRFVARSQFYDFGRFDGQGQPSIFTIEGTNFVFQPVPDGSYTGKLLYYAKPFPLSSTLTNQIMTDAPGIYLYGTLLEAALFLQADDKIAQWGGLYRGGVEGYNRSDDRKRNLGPLQMRYDAVPDDSMRAGS